jgi:hypothetical protein
MKAERKDRQGEDGFTMELLFPTEIFKTGDFTREIFTTG